MYYVFAGLNLNILFLKSARKMHLSWMMLRKQRALNKQMLRLGCCLPPVSKFLAMCLLATADPCLNFFHFVSAVTYQHLPICFQRSCLNKWPQWSFSNSMCHN